MPLIWTNEWRKISEENHSRGSWLYVKAIYKFWYDEEIYIYLKLAGENTAIQSSLDGVGELKSTVTQTVVSP